jgi:hypothetical protein
VTKPPPTTRPDPEPVPGPVLFARYAYPPNALGYCGPDDPSALLAAVAGGGDLAALSTQAQRFDGAWPYLEMIAARSGIDDPLDHRVVAAYWVGNDLVEGVAGRTLASALAHRFAGAPGADPVLIAEAIGRGAVAHHSFHVFAVYPWLTLLRSGREQPALTVLDQCRIRWGRVESLDGEMATVTSRSLAYERGRLVLAPERPEQVRRSRDDLGLERDLAAGDFVSLHWDWVCERLGPRELASLERCTSRNLDAVSVRPSGPKR